MVSQDYVKRLQDYITDQCAEHARKPGDKGVNAYSRYTERVLSEWGLSGFAAGQISRWLRGEVNAGLEDYTLQRLGLLRGLTRDPEQAEALARAWLNGDEMPVESLSLQVVAELPGRYEVIPVITQIHRGEYGPQQLRQIAIAAIDKLTDVAKQADRGNAEEPQETAVTWLLQGWMTQQGHGIEELASRLGTTVERAERIMQGYPMIESECWAVSKITRLKPETLIEWGVCPTTMVERHTEDFRTGIGTL